MRNRGLLASVGVATAAVTSFAGFAPAVVSTAGAVDGTDGANSTAADAAADGTYESCSAYFGYGKESEDAAIDLTTFPVTVEGGAPAGEAPTVENGGIDVVLVLTDVDGAELRCVPEEVTEEEWDATWGDGLEVNLPAWPGPGHYVYPTIEPVLEDMGPLAGPLFDAAPAAIGDLGELASVGFEVVGVPEGYTLVDPTQVQVLPQAFVGTFLTFVGFEIFGLGAEVSPLVTAVIEAAAGPEGVAAYTLAFEECVADGGGDITNPDDENLVAAINALAAFVIPPSDFEPITGPIGCEEVFFLYLFSAYIFSVQATIETESPITVSLPVEPTTTTTAPPPAAAAVVTPTFTG